ADGVYITWLRVDGQCFEAVTNVGNRPTFGAESFAIESHILNFHTIELLPDSELELFFLKRLRPEIKFPAGEVPFHIHRFLKTDPTFTVGSSVDVAVLFTFHAATADPEHALATRRGTGAGGLPPRPAARWRAVLYIAGSGRRE